MKALLAAGLPGVVPIVARSVLGEFVRNAMQGMGNPPRRHTYEECTTFLSDVAEVLSNVVPVGLRDVLECALRAPNRPLGQLLQASAIVWSEGFRASDLTRRVTDLCDLRVCLACVENGAEVLVTRNLEHFEALRPFCAVEPPSTFLRRFDQSDEG